MSSADNITVRESSEAEILEILRQPHQHGATPDRDSRQVVAELVGNGDDAAVLGPSAATVLTTDMLVEGTHFRTDLSSWTDIGRRAVVQNVSDIAAMGAQCSHLLVAVCLSGELPLTQVAELATGLRLEAHLHGAHIIGGDFTTGPVAVLTVTAIGTLASGERPVQLNGARPGDRLALTGWPGRAAAGFELLTAGIDSGELPALYRVPVLTPGAGPRARRAGASALTDVSDGLVRDLAGLAAASGVAAALDSTTLPVDPELLTAAHKLGAAEPLARVRQWVLHGGEDHGLLAAFPAGANIPEDFTVIGRMVEAEPGQVFVDGVRHDSAGWDSARGPHDAD